MRSNGHSSLEERLPPNEFSWHGRIREVRSKGMRRRSIEMIRFIFSLVFLMAVVGATSASAGPWGRGMGPGACDSPHAEAALGLTSEQSQKLQALRQAYLDEIAPLQNQLFGRNAELRLLWSAQEPDKEQIASKQKEINDLEQQIEDRSTRHRLSCREVLTPEQREKAAKFEGGRHRGPGRRSGGMWQRDKGGN